MSFERMIQCGNVVLFRKDRQDGVLDLEFLNHGTKAAMNVSVTDKDSVIVPFLPITSDLGRQALLDPLNVMCVELRESGMSQYH